MTEHKFNAVLKEGETYPKSAYDPSAKEKPYYAKYIDRAEAGLKTVKRVVFAGMSAFVILAIYGFYLISQLTSNAATMTQTMQEMSRNMQVMQSMNSNLAQMNQAVQSMAGSVNNIQATTGNMDRTFSTPMNAINSFMPWGNAPTQYPPPPQGGYPQRQ
jgi:methylthioribose-1-phosphate isomerase